MPQRRDGNHIRVSKLNKSKSSKVSDLKSIEKQEYNIRIKFLFSSYFVAYIVQTVLCKIFSINIYIYAVELNSFLFIFVYDLVYVLLLFKKF